MPSRKLLRLIVFGLLAIVLPLAAQQDPAHPIVATPVAVTDISSSPNLPIQPVGPQDLLGLQVYDAPELTRTVRVSDDGTIRLPMLKNTIRVQGLLPSDIEKLVAEELQREQLFVDPYVTVNIVDYHSRPISISGAVRTPTIFQAVGNTTLIDALARAGGVIPDQAGPEIIVTRPNGSTNTQSVQRINIKSLMSLSDPELNIKLTGGEDIRVPDVGKIIVAGSVTHPGPYPVMDGGANTVITAIAQAQGTIQYFSHTAWLYRPDANGKVNEIKIPLGDILARKKPDIPLQARDVLYVPDSSGRRIGQEIATALTGTSTGAVVAMMYVLR